MKKLHSIKGTHDILPNEIHKWKALESIVNQTCEQFGYQEIRNPIFEETRLFSRSVGEETDIVTKEMYSWEDVDGASLTLRPELTASVVRSYIQHNLGTLSPIQRLYYSGPLFRRERPQKGRQRQFHQFGVEAFGSNNPEQDVEIIAIAWKILSLCGLANDTTLNLNSIGSNECRNNYRTALKNYLSPYIKDFSKTSQHRFDTNPLRILDTKSEKEQEILNGAPKISDYHNKTDSTHFESLKEILKNMDLPFSINHKLVRGLDYYTGTVFEFNSNNLGAQDALLGGGRYNRLVETLGGKPTPGIGFAGSEFKTELANKMIDAFKKPIYWFIDQHVLKEILDKRNFESIPYHWNSWGLKSGGEVFSTAKGKKKYGHRYKNLKYTWFTDKEKLRYHKERNKNYGKS